MKAADGRRATLPIALAAALTACVASACRQPNSPPPIVWRNAAPGLDYARTEIAGDGSAAPCDLHVLRADPKRIELRVVLAQDAGKQLDDAGGFRTQAGALAALNGGFFDPDYRPLGLLVSKGAELSPLRKVDHGVFALAGGRALLAHAKTWPAPAQLEFAVECGPRLVVAGEVPHFRAQPPARRSVLAIDGQGRVLVVVTAGVVGLDALAQWLRAPADRGGMGAREALNLDGGPSSMLQVAAPGVQAEVRSPVQVPVGIALVARSP